MFKLLSKRTFLLLGFLYSISLQGQNVSSCNLNVDSLFQSHFLSLDSTIKCDTTKIFVPINDRQFVLLICFLSGIKIDINSYSGHPLLNHKEVLCFKIWYNQYRNKIECQSIKKGFLLLQEIMTEDVIDELDKLKIE